MESNKEKYYSFDYVSERIANNAFISHNNIRLGKVEPGYAELYCDLTDVSYNLSGTAHGGLYFAMGDTAAGTAARTDGREYVTQSADVHYIKSAIKGRLTARASVIHKGRTGCLLKAEVVNEDEEVCFTGNYYFYCVRDYQV